MNTKGVFAALCEKAKDVAVASRIAEASTRFSFLSKGQTVNESGNVIATVCQNAASSPVLMRSNSFSEMSIATFASDLDVLSVLATTGSSPRNSTETLTLDSLVEAICSDGRIVEILRNVVKSEEENTSKDSDSSEAAAAFVAVLTTIKNLNQPASSNSSKTSTTQRETGKRARSCRRTHKHASSRSAASNADEFSDNKSPQTSTNSTRYSFFCEPSASMESSGRHDHIIMFDETEENTLRAFGWMKAFDEKSGRSYYYTIDHSQVTWENPLI